MFLGKFLWWKRINREIKELYFSNLKPALVFFLSFLPLSRLLRHVLGRLAPQRSDGGRLLRPREGGVLRGRLLPHRAVDGSGSEAAGPGRDVRRRGRRHHPRLPELLRLPAGGAGESAGLHQEAAGARWVSETENTSVS